MYNKNYADILVEAICYILQYVKYESIKNSVQNYY